MLDLGFASFPCQPMQLGFFRGAGFPSISWALTAAAGTVKKSHKNAFFPI
jgi:hypothetical protein